MTVKKTGDATCDHDNKAVVTEPTCTEPGFTTYTCAKCGAKLIQRKDDTPETIRNRLSVYHAQTAPLVDFYRSKGLVRDIDCLGRSVEENHRLVRAALGL